jgi:DNA-binding IclR family transcriptional regulator
MPQYIQVLQRAARLLSAFEGEQPEMGVAELSRKLDLPKPTVYRILATLEKDGFIQQNPVNSKYRLGFRLVELGLLALEQISLRREALPYMQQLLEECGETVDLAVFDDGEMVYLEVLESPQPVKIAVKAGRRLPVHCTASGKAYLAFVDEREREAILSQDLHSYTCNTLYDPQSLLEDLERTRERGYSVSHEEFEVGIKAVGAPIMDDGDRVSAVIAVAGPAYRLPPERIDEIGEAVRRTAREISHHIGARVA